MLAEGYGETEMNDVVTGADYLKRLDYVDASSVGLWGLSYGGYAVLQILGTHPDAFAVGVSLAGLADVERYEEWAAETKFPRVESNEALLLGGEPWAKREAWDDASPRTHVENYSAPLYSFHGSEDRYVNVEQQDLMTEALLDLEKVYEAYYYPGESHIFSKRATWKRTFENIELAFEGMPSE